MPDLLDQPIAKPPVEPAAPAAPADVPLLLNGDHLSAAEFHRRYEAMGEGTRAELIEGVVYIHHTADMASPVSLEHSDPHAHLVMLCGVYAARTPGTLIGDNATVLLDNDNEPQPDAFLAVPKPHGQVTTERRGNKTYLAGPPELIIEVAASTANIDLHAKLRGYERRGVREYVVVLADDPREVRYHVLTNGRFTTQAPDADGLHRSAALPGFWLDPAALLAGDGAKLLDTLQTGLATPEHAASAKTLAGDQSP